MDKHTSSGEKSPLLDRKSWKHFSVSGEKPTQHDKQNIRVQYEPKVSMFSPGKLAVVLCVLLVEMTERMAYYGVIANLVLFCTSVLDFTSNVGTTISLIFSGTVYLIPIIGGYIADCWSSRFNVIFGSALIYICGLFLLLCSALTFPDLFSSLEENEDLDLTGRRVCYILGLVLVAIGTGGIKANVGPFGAQQVQDLGPEAVQVYFNWFYWFINAGGLISYSAIAYVQQNVGFSWGFLIPLFSMFISVVLLNIARTYYIYKVGQGSILGTTFRICGQALCRKSPSINGRRKVFDSARLEYGGDFSSNDVDGVVAVVNIIPVFFYIIMFWAIYSQMQSTYFLQGERMDLSIGSGTIPVAMLNVFNTVAVMVTIPILDRLIYPCFRRMGRPLTYLQRMGVGLVLSACSVFLAGIIEIERKKHLGFDQTVGDETFYAANISVFVQIPQFMFVGSGEAFTSIAGYEFAYTQAPNSMQGAVMGVFLVTNGLGNYISTAVLAIVESATQNDPWFPDDINDGKAEYVFFLFGGLMVFFFIGYIPTARWYKYRKFKSDKEVQKEKFENDVDIF